MSPHSDHAIVDSPTAFRDACIASSPAPALPACARAVMLVEPTGFALSAQTASDNAYMDLAQRADPERALAQHRVLAQAIAMHTKLPVQVFAGDPQTPDAVFPNNAFASAPGTLLLGAMRHPERQRETVRADIPAWFAQQLGYASRRIDAAGAVCELTGSSIIDRARGIGYHGITERLNRAGVAALHEALGLRLSFVFELSPGEYHTNVVMSVLAGRALVIHSGSFADPEVPRAIAEIYAPHVVELSDAEKAAFAGNCIALTADSVWMSAVAERALSYANREILRRAGFLIHTVELDEIEKAGGSLRCCVAEIY